MAAESAGARSLGLAAESAGTRCLLLAAESAGARSLGQKGKAILWSMPGAQTAAGTNEDVANGNMQACLGTTAGDVPKSTGTLLGRASLNKIPIFLTTPEHFV